MLTCKKIRNKNPFGLVEIENGVESRKEFECEISELQSKNDVKIVSELCKHPW